jgi:hypothetical protein
MIGEAMATRADGQAAPNPDADSLERVFAARGLERFVLFGVTGEGREMPNGIEEASGYALTPDGRVHFFWTGWDAERGQEIIRTWEEATPDEAWDDDDEYLAARQRLGLRVAV